MAPRPYGLTGPVGARGTLGLIVLQVDETIEQDFRRLFPDPRVAIHVSRIRSGARLTPETIAAMESDLPRAAALLPPAASFDVIAYACTSGAALIGPDAVASLVAAHATTRGVTDPLTASTAALRAMRVGSVAIVSPYVASVAEPMRAAFRAAGFDVPATISFGEETEARVARIDPASIRDAALEAGTGTGVDAVFLSCTNLRTLDIIGDLESRLGRPVIASNQALAWHMARASGAPVAPDPPGRLFRA
jgi:maleate isomerase